MTGGADTNERQEFKSALGAHSERWRHCEAQPETGLLRLAILRDVVRDLHARKSRLLATGKRDRAQDLRAWEARLNDLRNHSRLEGDLVELVVGSEEIRKRTRLLPEALTSAIGKEKLERYDRVWEMALAGEGVAQGWKFWRLEAWVEITLAEEWNQRLAEQLWPAGIVLFVESAATPAASATPSETTFENPLWRGSWLLLVHPRFAKAAEIPVNIGQWPGTPPHAPSPPQWKLVYAPKGR